MWMPKGQVPKRRLFRVPPLDDAAHLVRRPIGSVRFFGQEPWAVAVFIITHPMLKKPPCISLVAEEQLIVVYHTVDLPPLLIQDDIVKADTITLRVNM